MTSLILKNEVTVNHFPKARYFSSKVSVGSRVNVLFSFVSLFDIVYVHACLDVYT